MQVDFSAAGCTKTQNRNVELIKQAIVDGAYIVFAHYIDYGDTHERLVHPTRNYPHVGFCWANCNDKSEVFRNHVDEKGVTYYRIVVTGVNTSACVYNTVTGLQSSHKSIVDVCVVQEACNDAWNDNGYAFRTMSEKGVTLY